MTMPSTSPIAQPVRQCSVAPTASRVSSRRPAGVPGADPCPPCPACNPVSPPLCPVSSWVPISCPPFLPPPRGRGGAAATARPAAFFPLCGAGSAEQLLAGGLAPPAGLRTDPAVLVHRRVRLTLVPAGLARRRARLEHRAGQVRVVPAGPGQHPPGRLAHVGAVGADPDALDQLGRHVLAQAG